MVTRNAKGGRFAAAAMMLLLGAGLACPTPAAAGKFPRHIDGWRRYEQRKQTCTGRQTLVRIETRTCPANPNRDAVILKRACCKMPRRNRVVCKPFGGCPPRSPS